MRLLSHLYSFYVSLELEIQDEISIRMCKVADQPDRKLMLILYGQFSWSQCFELKAIKEKLTYLRHAFIRYICLELD